MNPVVTTFTTAKPAVACSLKVIETDRALIDRPDRKGLNIQRELAGKLLQIPTSIAGVSFFESVVKDHSEGSPDGRRLLTQRHAHRDGIRTKLHSGHRWLACGNSRSSATVLNAPERVTPETTTVRAVAVSFGFLQHEPLCCHLSTSFRRDALHDSESAFAVASRPSFVVLTKPIAARFG
jgi:hypothetical protein